MLPIARKLLPAVSLLAVLAAGPAQAQADPVADFYRGKTLRMLIGYGPGGGYDIYGRLAAEFLGRHIPGNPTIIPVNMPGGASLKVVDYLYQVAPKDGTHFGSVAQQLAMNAVTSDKSAYDLTRLRYLGRLTSNIDIAVAMPKTGIRSFEEARKREIVIGTDHGGSMSSAYAKALTVHAGARFKIIRGYSGSAEVQLAAERGEVEVNGSYSLPAVLVSHPEWVRDRSTAAILYQNALKRFHELQHVPTVLDLMQTDEGRAVARVIAGAGEIGRSIVTAPDLPPERLAALRVAFQAMLKDPDFVAATKKRNQMLDPGTGEAMEAITRETMALPKETVVALRKVLQD